MKTPPVHPLPPTTPKPIPRSVAAVRGPQRVIGLRKAHSGRKLRLAFLSPEYVTTQPDGGGLASYLARIGAALRSLGHEVEVFTLATGPGRINHHGVRVEHVTPASKGLLEILGGYWRMRRLCGGTIDQLRGALALAGAFHRRDQERPFDIVQSSDWGISGYFVRPSPRRVHLVRCSWSRPLYQAHAGMGHALDARLLTWLEGRCIRRADWAYAPSRFIAEDLATRWRVPVGVIRPPMIKPPSEGVPPAGLPPRYLIHLGQLSSIKGTDLVGDALLRAWQEEPRLRLVLAGREAQPGLVQSILDRCRKGESRVIWLGALPRPSLYAVLKRAAAAVLPSRCDNLPNAAIESLALRVPVIGSRGASLDEIIEDGCTGRLVPVGDVDALAQAMAQAWRRPRRLSPRDLQSSPLLQAMRPTVAAQTLIDAAMQARQTHRQAA
ncbi:MAG TPA: glycosyltransferase family 4 protein [Phycisphaeraceae bacterium]